MESTQTLTLKIFIFFNFNLATQLAFCKNLFNSNIEFKHAPENGNPFTYSSIKFADGTARDRSFFYYHNLKAIKQPIFDKNSLLQNEYLTLKNNNIVLQPFFAINDKDENNMLEHIFVPNSNGKEQTKRDFKREIKGRFYFLFSLIKRQSLISE